MRILHIIATADPRSGGPWTLVRDLASEHRAMGHETHAVTMDPPSAAFLRQAEFPVFALGPALFGNKFSPNLALWLRRHAGAYDGVVVHGVWNFGSLAAWLTLGGRQPYVVFTHGMLDPWFGRFKLKAALKRLYFAALERHALRHAEAVLFTTYAERDGAMLSTGQGFDNARILPLGSREPPQDSAAKQQAFEAAVPEIIGQRYLLFMGRLHPKKGLDLLLRAFARVAAEMPELHLVIAGPDGHGTTARIAQDIVDAGVFGRVHLAGMLQGTARWGAIRGAEAFVLPSHQENFGLAVTEAMACGVPVLISDKVEIWPEIQRSGAGFVEADTAEGTERLLRRFLALSDPERQAMGRSAREAFQRNFHIERTARGLLRILNEQAQAVAAKQLSGELV
jgi:glycosyltransferase involved in cell wall biosynthesis